jgi:hypothetical protein
LLDTRILGFFHGARVVPRAHPAAANPASPHGATSTADGSPNLTWVQRLKRVRH